MDELIHKLAEARSTTPAQAADEIDKVIHSILKKLRRGQPARLPGLGHFLPGRQFRPETTDESRTDLKPVRRRR
jgi:nucleoid DNA-binding protein